MNEKMNSNYNNASNYDCEKKNNGVKVLLIILIILVLCLIGLLSYKIFVVDKKNDNNVVENSDKTELNDEKMQAIANEMYLKFVSLENLCGGFRFPDLNDESKRLLYAYDKINPQLIKKVNTDAELSYDRCGAVYDKGIFNDECLLETVKVSDFEKVYKSLFGGNSQLDYSKLPYNYSVKDGNINKYHTIFGCEGGILTYSKLEKYENSNNELNLYIDVISFYVPSVETGEILDLLKKSSPDDLYSNKLTVQEKETLFNTYKDKMISYKLKFNQDIDGNYYFVNVKEI